MFLKLDKFRIPVLQQRLRSGIAAWNSSFWAWIEGFVSHGMVDSCSPFHVQEKIVICFIQVNHLEPMDHVVAGLILCHHGHKFLPSVKGLNVIYHIIEKGQASINDSLSFLFECVIFRSFLLVGVSGLISFVVARMDT